MTTERKTEIVRLALRIGALIMFAIIALRHAIR